MHQRVLHGFSKLKPIKASQSQPNKFPQIGVDESNHDCMIRPYLGRKRTQQVQSTHPSRFRVFSVRNYPLPVDQMEKIGLSSSDLSLYIRTMAEALATLRWASKIDGNDIESVLAPATEQQAPSCMSNVLGGHTMWICLTLTCAGTCR